MARAAIDRPAVNPPCEEPAHRWRYEHAARRGRIAHEVEVELHGRQGQPFVHRIPARLRRLGCRLHRAVLDSLS